MRLDHISCPYCDKQFHNSTLNSLRVHVLKLHKLGAQKLYDDLFMSGQKPNCACGCGNVPKFWSLQLGYAKFIRGHQSRIKNNWGHNKRAQQKSQRVRKEMHQRGEIKVWNKGLTKNHDDRIASYGEKCSHTLKHNNHEQRSEHMKNQWLVGTITSLTGSQHPQWKGGSSALQPHIRSHVFNAWSRPIMKRDGFRCQFCSSQSNLCVHHSDPENEFAKILQLAIAELGEYVEGNFVLKESITKWVVDYHLQNDVKGITLCEHCHNHLHAV